MKIDKKLDFSVPYHIFSGLFVNQDQQFVRSLHKGGMLYSAAWYVALGPLVCIRYFKKDIHSQNEESNKFTRLRQGNYDFAV